jgi:hypothetical protein
MLKTVYPHFPGDLGINLYDIVNFFIENAHNTIPTWWTVGTAGGIYALVLFCLVLIPKPTLLIKASSFAFIFVIAIGIIIIITGFFPEGGIDMSTVKYAEIGFGSSIGVLSVCVILIVFSFIFRSRILYTI